MTTPPAEPPAERSDEAAAALPQALPPDVTAEDVAAAESAVGPVARWAVHRHLYDWVLSLAHRKHATTALFLLSFAESSFFPVPPDVLLAPMCLGHRRRSLWFATVTTAASVLGAFFGYLLGMELIGLALHVPGITQARVDALAAEFAERGTVYVFVAALTPIPFKLLTITAGFAHLALLPFAVACLIGRATRFYGVAGLFWWLGPKALPFIDRWFNALCLAFVVLLVGGFLVLKAVAH